MTVKRRGAKEDLEWLNVERRRISRPWREALRGFREHLADQCRILKDAERRFQDGALAKRFVDVVRSGENIGRTVVDAYWLFCGSPWAEQLGFNAARQRHLAEMRARGLSNELGLGSKMDFENFVEELLFRLSSLLSWVEAQETWGIWLFLNRAREVWTLEDDVQRERAWAAVMLASMPSMVTQLSNKAFGCLWLGGELGGKESAGIIEGCDFRNSGQWANVLQDAAKIANSPPTEPNRLKKWVWWNYSIFRRYRWSAAEIHATAIYCGFGNLVKEAAGLQQEWIRGGLRFTGRRQSRKHPPLWEFVCKQPIPEVDDRVSLWF